MDRTRNLDVKLFARDPARPEMTPLPIYHDDARAGGHAVAKMISATLNRGDRDLVIRVVGPDAGQAAEILRNLFDGPPPSLWEFSSTTRAWNKRTRETHDERRKKTAEEARK